MGTGPLFLPNTMKIKLLIIKLSLKAWVLKHGRKAISSTQRVSVSDKSFAGVGIVFETVLRMGTALK